MGKQKLLDVAKAKCAKDKALIIGSEFPQLVYGKGSPEAQIFFIGEAPGKNEALQGLPFVGAAGKNLDKLLNSINLSLDECYVANILKCRPPNNRPPQPGEMHIHVPYLVEQINIIKPKVIITLGNFSTKLVLAKFDINKMKEIVGISQIHGKIHKITIGKEKCTVIPLYHPAACIYNPKLRNILLDDFQEIRHFLNRRI